MDIPGTPQQDDLVDTSGNDRIDAGGGDDFIDVTNGLDEVDGGAGSDLLRIHWASETTGITSGAAGAGFDFRLVGGAGRRIDFRGVEDVEVEAGSGNDAFTMGSTNDRILDGPRNAAGTLPTGNDVIGGGGGNDTISFATGNDTADGGPGEDTIIIAWSGSTIPVLGAAASAGFDARYESGPGRSIDLVGFERIFINGGSANDVITTGAGRDLIDDGPQGAFDDDVMNGAGGDDDIQTRSGHDIIDGGQGSSDLARLVWSAATAPIISVAARDGYDLRFESGAGYSVDIVNAETVSIFGGSGDDVITAGAESDIYLDGIGASSGDDFFDGGAGDDFQTIRTGRDRADGGTGNDTVQFNWGAISVPILMEAPSAGYQIRFTAGTGNSADLRNVEEIILFAGTASDVVHLGEGEDVGFGGKGNDVIDGRGGDDYLAGESGDDELIGGAGDDELEGVDGNDTLRGGDGNDYLYPGTGADNMFGDEGDDAGFLGDSSDTFTGGGGMDTAIVEGPYASFTVRVSPDTEVLLIGSGTDTRFGDGNALYDYNIVIPNGPAGSNAILTVQATGLVAEEDLVFDGSAQQNGQFRIFAGRGVDRLTGGGGNDGFFFDADANGSLTGADRVNGGGGADTIALRGDYTGGKAVAFAEDSITAVEVVTFLTGHANPYGGPIVASGFDYSVTMANGNVAAGARLDVIGTTLGADESVAFDGRAEADGSYRIILGAGQDSVFASQGADLIHGGLGADQLDGSGGADVYSYRSVADSTASATDRLVLGDGDRIDLGAVDADSAADGDQAFVFIGDAAFGNVAGQLRAFQSGNLWVIEGDVNGDGAADIVIHATSADPIIAADFML